MKRLSRGTPYFMTDTEIEAILASIREDSVLEEAVAAASDMTVADWRRLPKGKRVQLWQKLQERGRLAAVGAAAIKARREFVEQSFMHQNGYDDPNHLAERIKELQEQMNGLTEAVRAANEGNRV